MSSSKAVNLEKFESKFKLIGVNLPEYTETNNFNEPIKELILHLKHKSKFKIYYEKLDPNLLDLVNDVRNMDIKHFHRDNFLRFSNFSNELLNSAIVSKVNK